MFIQSSQTIFRTVKSSLKLVWIIYFPMWLTDWLQVEVALLLIGWPKSLLSKTGFDRLGRDQLSFRPSAQLSIDVELEKLPVSGARLELQKLKSCA
jgi:hypothetical protein